MPGHGAATGHPRAPPGPAAPLPVGVIPAESLSPGRASDRVPTFAQGDVGAAAVDANVLEAEAAPSLHLKKKGELDWGPFLRRFG